MKKSGLILPLLIFSFYISQAEVITGISGFFRHGQVFLTWNKATSATAYYKVYRSEAPISSSSTLANSEYLGITDSKSAKDFNLSVHDGTDRFLHIDSGAIPLSASKCLFVATTLQNGSYYYAITIVINGLEDTNITSGTNSLMSPIVETVMSPSPVFQERRTNDNIPYDIYTTFFSTKMNSVQPIVKSAGFIASDFAIYRSTGTGVHPLRMKFHGGGTDFLNGITTTMQNEIILSCEDEFPSGETTAWWGTNENFDITNAKNNLTPPSAGINYNYTLLRLSATIDWVCTHLPVDTDRIYLEGVSFGAPGAYFYTITYPEKIAASKISVGVFNFAFQSDYQPTCSLNTGKKNRKSGDSRFGKISTNLMTNTGYPIYNVLNGGWMIDHFNNKSYPVMYCISGKRDDLMGWSEKPVYYDSINANHIGGYYFWDNRDHGGNGATWDNGNFDFFRYRRNLSFPAFSHCSLNEDYGTGNGAIGPQFGSVNGSLDWKNQVKDEVDLWEAKIFVRNLVDGSNHYVIYPDSSTVDITPRRTQQFNPEVGEMVNWTVIHKNQVIQSGTETFDGNCLVLKNIKIFRDTSILQITRGQLIKNFYSDADGDGFGNPSISMQGFVPPQGYVENSLDCDDAYYEVHPGAVDVCNGLDDNCDGFIDENAIQATVIVSGPTTFCAGQSVNFSADAGNGSFLFQWNNNSLPVSGAVNPTFICEASGNYSINISNGICSFLSTTYPIIVHPLPAAEVTPTGTVYICKGKTLTLSANMGSGLAYQWFKDNAAIDGASASSYSTTNNVSGNFNVIVSDSNECSNASGITALINVNKPAAKITVLTYPDLCENNAVTLESSGKPQYTYKWYKNDQKITGELSQNYNATEPGSYSVKVTENTAGCNKTSLPVNIYSSCKNISENNLSSGDFNIYPNPSDGRFTLTFKEDQSAGMGIGKGTVKVSDLLGEMIYTEIIELPQNTFSAAINLPLSCTNGIYLLILNMNGKSFSSLLSINR